MTYIDRIKKDSKEVSQEQDMFLAKSVKLQSQADLLEVERQISQKNQELKNLKSSREAYSLTKIGELQWDIERLDQVLCNMRQEFKEAFGK